MKNKKIVREVSATVLAASILLGGAATMIGVRNNMKVSSASQVSTIANELDADLTVLTNNDRNVVYRMEHNNGEPIYVSVDEDFNDVEKQHIKWSLDYVFGVVGEINDNYKYEIVSEQNRKSESDKGKTTIRFEEDKAFFTNGLGMSDRTEGLCSRGVDKISTYSDTPVYDTFLITYDRENNEKYDDLERRYTFLHELVHAFGFDDVHNTLAHSNGNTRFCGNTVMNSKIGTKTSCFTPDDYRCIISAYAPRMNEQELVSFIKEYKQKVKDYDESYYGAYSALCENKLDVVSDLDTTKDYAATYQRKLTDEKGNVIIENISIEIKDGKYDLKIFDKNGVLLDETSGITIDCKNTFLLKDAELEKGLRPLTQNNQYINSYINDFVFMKDSKTGKYIFYDLADNDGLYLKDVQEIEKNAEMGD